MKRFAYVMFVIALSLVIYFGADWNFKRHQYKVTDYEIILINHGQNEKLRDYLIRHNLACWPKDVKGPNADKVYDYVIVASETSFWVADYKKAHPNDAVWLSCVGGDIKDAKVLIFKNDEKIDLNYFNPPKHGIMMTGSEWN